MNWDDPTQRAALIEREGPAAYNAAFREHLAQTSSCIENGYPIRILNGFRTTPLYAVSGTTLAFSTMEAATAHARTLPIGSAAIELAEYTHALNEIYATWLNAHQLPPMDPAEYLISPPASVGALTPGQRLWLTAFIKRYDALEDRESKERASTSQTALPPNLTPPDRVSGVTGWAIFRPELRTAIIAPFDSEAAAAEWQRKDSEANGDCDFSIWPMCSPNVADMTG